MESPAPSPRLPIVDAAAWMALDRPDKAELLIRGGCMPSQGRREERDADDGRPARLAWGQGFDLGCSPVVQFALERGDEALEDALGMGACPLARDSEQEGLFEVILRRLAAMPPSERPGSPAARMLGLAWSAAEPFLDPGSPSFIGEPDAAMVRFDIAMAAFWPGAASVREAGLPLDAHWLVDRADTLPALLSMALQHWSVEDLRELHEAGMDFTKPITFSEDDPPESLWTWLMDMGPDPVAAGHFLLSVGNDPRELDSTGRTALDAMLEEPSTRATALHFQGLLRSAEERSAIEGAARRAPSQSKKQGL